MYDRGPVMGPLVVYVALIYKAKPRFKAMHQSCTNNLQGAT
jgi:hypothetical protein